MLYLGYAAYWVGSDSHLMTAVNLDHLTKLKEMIISNGPISKSNKVVLPLWDRSYVTLFRIESLALSKRRLAEILRSPFCRTVTGSLGTPYGGTLVFIRHNRYNIYPYVWQISNPNLLRQLFRLRESEISFLIGSSPDPLRVLRDGKETVYVK